MAAYKNEVHQKTRVIRKKFISMADFTEATGIKFNLGMGGKMLDINCLSTSCLNNPRCIARMKAGDSVCSECFSAAAQEGFRGKNLKNNMMENTILLNAQVFPVEAFPLVNSLVFRFESWGDLNTKVQALNYFHMCRRNPRTQFALWTKNPDILEEALAIEEKPENLVVVYSSPKINVPDLATLKRYPFIDKLFTVYEKDFAEENGIEINCGGRSCLNCQTCYWTDNGVVFVNELLK